MPCFRGMGPMVGPHPHGGPGFAFDYSPPWGMRWGFFSTPRRLRDWQEYLKHYAEDLRAELAAVEEARQKLDQQDEK